MNPKTALTWLVTTSFFAGCSWCWIDLLKMFFLASYWLTIPLSALATTVFLVMTILGAVLKKAALYCLGGVSLMVLFAFIFGSYISLQIIGYIYGIDTNLFLINQ